MRLVGLIAMIVAVSTLTVLPVEGQESFKSAWSSALKTFEEGDFEGARPGFLNALALARNDADRARAYLHLAYSYHWRHDPDKGRAYYAKVLDLTNATLEQKSEAMLQVGMTLNDNEKWSDAQTVFERLLTAPSLPQATRAQALSGLGYSLMGQSRFAAARRRFNEVIAMPSANPADVACAYQLTAHTWINEGKPEKAGSFFEKVLEIEQAPPHIMAEACLATAWPLYDRKRLADAGRLCDRVLTLRVSDDQKSEARRWLGRIAFDSGELDKARELFETILMTEGAAEEAVATARDYLRKIEDASDP